MENCFSENPRFSRGFQFCEHLEMVFLLFIGEHSCVPVVLNFFLFEKRDMFFSCAKQEKNQKKFASVPLDRSANIES